MGKHRPLTVRLLPLDGPLSVEVELSNDACESSDDEGRDRKDGNQGDDGEELSEESRGVGQDSLGRAWKGGVTGSDV